MKTVVLRCSFVFIYKQYYKIMPSKFRKKELMSVIHLQNCIFTFGIINYDL